MSNRLKVTKDDLAKVLKSIGALASSQVLVGIPQEEAERDDDERGAMNNATLGYIHDNGSPANNIPARPFMKPGIKAAEKAIDSRMKKTAKDVLDGHAEKLDAGLNAVGLIAQNAVKSKINSGDFPPLSVSTLRARARRGRKGAKEELMRMKEAKKSGQDFTPNAENARPLIDTGQLRNSISYVIRKK